MAAHVRQQLREAIGAALIGLPLTGDRVFQSRIYPLEEAELPGICVFVTSELTEPWTIGSDYRREVFVTIAAYAAQASDLDDTLDEMSKKIEAAVDGLMIGAKPSNLTYTGIEIDFNGDVARPHGIANLSYTATLFTLAAVPDVLL